MNDDQLLRYSRHILLDEIGIEGQRRLLASHALVIGAGGLGSPVALYLGTAGVGRITIVDHDTVDVTNLQRQIAHDLARLGMAKAASAARSIAAINPLVEVVALHERADAGARQVECHRRAETAQADDQRMAVEKPLLAFDADLVEQDVARVAQQLGDRKSVV